MNILDFATEILAKPQFRQRAISNLEHGLKHEEKWNEQHKREVKQLVDFLKSGSNNIDDLEKYCPVS